MSDSKLLMILHGEIKRLHCRKMHELRQGIC